MSDQKTKSQLPIDTSPDICIDPHLKNERLYKKKRSKSAMHSQQQQQPYSSHQLRDQQVQETHKQGRYFKFTR